MFKFAHILFIFSTFSLYNILRARKHDILPKRESITPQKEDDASKHRKNEIV